MTDEQYAVDLHDEDVLTVLRALIGREPTPLEWDSVPYLAALRRIEERLEDEEEHEAFTPQEGDRGYTCDDDGCPLAPHVALSPDGAHEFRNGSWGLSL